MPIKKIIADIETRSYENQQFEDLDDTTLRDRRP